MMKSNAEEQEKAFAGSKEIDVNKRKQEARDEVNAIYEDSKYDTYNFKKLPQEFKDRLRTDFGQWIDANIAQYDKDGDSTIDAAEYAKFKQQLNEKVRAIIERLIGLKKEASEEAKNTKEAIEQARETQKKLEGIDVSKLDPNNLKSAEGMYLELQKYQRDFELEVKKFGALSRTFGDARKSIEDANKSHQTGLTAVGEYVYSWAYDIPEVMDANHSKKKAVAEFDKVMAEMKARLEQRKSRGTLLNLAPEEVMAEKRKKYDAERIEISKYLDKLREKKKADEEARKKLLSNREELEQKLKELSSKYQLTILKIKQAQARKLAMQKKKEEMTRAAQALEGAGSTAAREKALDLSGSGEREGGKIMETANTMKAVTGEVETGLEVADRGILKIQNRAAKMLGELQKMKSADETISADSNKLESSISQSAQKIDQLEEAKKQVDLSEKTEMKQLGQLDDAISSTVLEVDTSNFELVKQGNEFLSQLKKMEVKGPGFLDMAGAAIMGIPGVEYTGNKLTQAFEWTKTAPVIGDVIKIAGYMGEGWGKGWDAIGSGLSWVGDKLHMADAWEWMGRASKHLSMDNATGNKVVDFVLDTVVGDIIGTSIERFSGVTAATAEMVQGIGMMLKNPLMAVRGIAAIINHPMDLVNMLIQKDKWGEESINKLIGRGAFDVITAILTGGATSTAVKTTLAGAKIGGLSVGRAALLGAKTFGRVFVRDIKGAVVTLVDVPVTLIKGTGNLLKYIGSGGKKIGYVEEVASHANTLQEAERAYQAIEAVRDQPDNFWKLVNEHPEYLDLHGSYLQTEAKAERAATRKAQAENRRKMKKTKKVETTKPVESGVKPVEEAAKPVTDVAEMEPAGAKPAAEVAEAQPVGAKPAAEVAEAPPVGAKPAAEVAEAPPARAMEVQADDVNAANTVDNEMPLAEAKRLTEVKPNTERIRVTDERERLITQVDDILKNNPAGKAATKEIGADEVLGLIDRLPDREMQFLVSNLDSLDPLIVEKILKQEYGLTMTPDGQILHYYQGKVLGEGAFGTVSECFYVTQDGVKFERAAIKVPRDTTSLKGEVDSIQEMLREGKLSVKEKDNIRNRVRALQKRLAEGGMPEKQREELVGKINQLRNMLIEKNLSEGTIAYYRALMAELNAQINGINSQIANERLMLQALGESDIREGLIGVRALSRNGLEPVILYDQIVPETGKSINLEDRMLTESPDRFLELFNELLTGLKNLHENGFFHGDFKPNQGMVGYIKGRAAEGAERAYLGDLSVMAIEEVGNAVGINLSGSKLQGSSTKLGSSSIRGKSNITGISGTQGYFSPAHFTEMLGRLKKAKEEGMEIPLSVVSKGDNNAVGVCLEKYRNKIAENRQLMAERWGIDADGMQMILDNLDESIRRLKDPKNDITVSDVIENNQRLIDEIRGVVSTRENHPIMSAEARPTI